MKKILYFLTAMILVMSCEEIQLIDNDDPQANDSVYALDTVAKIDSVICDTVFICELNEVAQVIYDDLLDAYEKGDESALRDFLNEWNENHEAHESIPDSLQDLYAVYKEFYSPWDLDRIAESEFGSDIYEGIEYYIIQKDIRYNYAFRSYEFETITIQDFRPRINNDAIRLLYLNDNFEAAINCFLGSGNEAYDYCYSIAPPFPTDEINRRARYLSIYLQFFHGHWGNYWHLETHPEVDYISFSASKDSAQVHFRLGYQGGEVILGKNKDAWKIVDHYMTWIE